MIFDFFYFLILTFFQNKFFHEIQTRNFCKLVGTVDKNFRKSRFWLKTILFVKFFIKLDWQFSNKMIKIDQKNSDHCVHWAGEYGIRTIDYLNDFHLAALLGAVFCLYYRYLIRFFLSRPVFFNPTLIKSYLSFTNSLTLGISYLKPLECRYH